MTTQPARSSGPRLPGWLFPLFGGGALLLALLGAVLVASQRGDDGVTPEVPPVAVSYAGEEAPRLGPVTVTFREPPATRDHAQLVALSPAAPAAYAWANDHTLIVQPEFPGFRRGGAYELRVHAAAAGLDEDYVAAFTVEGRLAVDAVIPAPGDVEVPPEAEIYVQFSRSVAPLTTLQSQPTDAVITFDPPLEGAGEWLNTSVYRFVPADLRPSTVYTARIAAGLTAEDDGVLEDDYEWRFETIGPALARSDPADNSLFLPRDSVVTLEFNQAMDRAGTEAGVRLETDDGATVATTSAWSDDGATLTLTPAEPLALSTRYRAVIGAGLPGANGGATATERAVAFSTSDPPALVRSSPPDGSSNASRWGIELEFNNPMDVGSIEDRLAISDIDPSRIDVFSWDGRMFHVAVPLQPSTTYTLAIAAGATDREGLPLDPVEITFTTGRLESNVWYATPGGSRHGTYSSAVEQELYFYVTNHDSVSFDLYRLPDDLGRIYLDPSRPEPEEARVVAQGELLRSWEVTTEGSENAQLLRSTSLGNGEPLEPGYYFVHTPDLPVGHWGASLLFAVTDVEIVTKLALDELLVWAFDHATGAPLDGVALDVRGPSVNETVTTDGDGFAVLPVPSRRELSPNTFRAYTVRTGAGEPFGVARTDWQQGAAIWQLGMRIEWMPRHYVGHVYTDRPIYRTGETVHFKAVLRIDDDATYRLPEPGDTGLRMRIWDATGTEIDTIDVVVNEYGTIAGEFTIAEGAATGPYQLQIIETGPWETWVAGASFLVAEFRRPEFQVEVSPDAADYVNGETMEVTTEATFFFGGPVPNAPVSWSVLAFPTSVQFRGYERYSFTDFDMFEPSVFEDPLRASGDATAGADGVASFSVPAALRAAEGAQEFTISATVQDESGQAIAGSAGVTVHPAEFYAGIATRSYVATAGEEATLDLVTVDVAGEPAPGRSVAVSVYERQWITVREEAEGGGQRYRSEPDDTLVETLSVTTADDGTATVAYTPTSAGTLRIVAQTTDPAGRTASAAQFLWVTGTEHVSWFFRNDDVIELVADRDEYAVGDVAEVLVPVPFEGAVGLVTVERGRILDHSVRTFDSSSEVLRIALEDVHVPNAYVGVVLYRPPTEDDPVPRYHVGYAQLNVSAESRRLDVAITADRERAAPGELVTFEVAVTDHEGAPVQAELSAAVVDEAVLSLAAETGPDGMGAFWFERGLGVETASSLAVSIDRANDLISEPEAGGKGGGEDGEDTRGDFRNTAHWEGQLLTDANGRATFQVRMPDNLTTWRTQVRAVSGDTLVGEAVHELLVTRPVLLRPALPRFLRTGDAPDLRVLVHNGTAEAQEVAVTIEATGVSVEGAATQTRSVAPGTSVAFAWPARAERHGEAEVTFRASGGGMTDAVTLTLPVLRDVTTEVVATGGTVTDRSAVEHIYLPPFAITDDGTLDVSLQGSLVGALAAELGPLARRTTYELESPMHAASRIIATIKARRAEGADDALTASLRDDVRWLRSVQRVDGGWGWCRTCRTDVAVTGWVLFALGEAREAGVPDLEGAAGRASALVREHVNRAADVARPADPNERAFLLYTLQHAGGALWVENSLRSLVEQDRANLSAWGASYAILGLLGVGAEADDPLVRALVADLNASMLPSATGNHWEAPPLYGTFETNTSTTALVLRALIAADPNHPLIEETVRWLVNARSARAWETNVEVAQAIASLGRYAELTGERLGDYAYTVTLDGAPLLGGRFRPAAGDNADEAVVALADLTVGEVHRVALERELGPGRLYYGLDLRYVTPAAEVEALNRGLAVSRRYTLVDDPDRPIEEARLGDLVRVTLTIVAPADRKYVLVEDHLPAGLEGIDAALQIVPEEVRQQLQQEQRATVRAGVEEYMAPWHGWYWSPWDETNVFDDRFTLFATELPRGVHEYVYYARATTPGDFFVAPACASEEAMPDVFGRSDSGTFAVR